MLTYDCVEADLPLPHPRVSHRPLHEGLGLAIVAEPPAFRIPLQGPIQTRNDLAEQADGHRTAPALDIADVFRKPRRVNELRFMLESSTKRLRLPELDDHDLARLYQKAKLDCRGFHLLAIWG